MKIGKNWSLVMYTRCRNLWSFSLVENSQIIVKSNMWPWVCGDYFSSFYYFLFTFWPPVHPFSPPLTTTSLFPVHRSLQVFWLCGCVFKYSIYKTGHMVFGFFCLTYFIMSLRFIHHVANDNISFFFMAD